MRFKTHLRRRAAELLFHTGLIKPTIRVKRCLTIVTFHRVLDEAERRSYPYPTLAVTPQELDAFLAYFTEHFDCGALAGQHDRYSKNKTSVRPLLAITFDDAPHDNYRNARPVLARYRVKASFFTPVDSVSRQELLWHDRLGFALVALAKTESTLMPLNQLLRGAGISDSGPNNLAENLAEKLKRVPLATRLRVVRQVEELAGGAEAPDFARPMTFHELADLAADGHEIGSHSMTHCLMTECDERTLHYEIAESRRILQLRTGQSVDAFCYPNGNFDAPAADAVAEAGYRFAVTTEPGPNAQSTDRFRLHRFHMDSDRVRGNNGELVPALIAFRMSGLSPGILRRTQER